jgi:hypothetical protein
VENADKSGININEDKIINIITNKKLI